MRNNKKRKFNKQAFDIGFLMFCIVYIIYLFVRYY